MKSSSQIKTLLPPPVSRHDNLSILRVISCIMVFIVHFGQRMNIESISTIARQFTNYGAMGVYMFFLISGFLSFSSNKQLNTAKNIFSYYLDRAIRILPLYFAVILYFYITETFIFQSVPTDDTGLYWFRYIFLLAGIVNSPLYFWSNLGITWTIFIFAIYYVLVPLFRWLVKCYKHSLVFFIICLILRYLINRFCGIYLQSLSYLVYFAVGTVTYYAFKEQKSNLTIALFALLSIFFLVLYNTSTPLSNTMLYGIIVLTTMNIQINNHTLRNVIKVMDEYSYALYLGHGIIFCGILDKYNLPLMPRLLVAILGSIILSVLLHILIEKPIHLLYNYLKNKRNSALTLEK